MVKNVLPNSLSRIYSNDVPGTVRFKQSTPNIDEAHDSFSVLDIGASDGNDSEQRATGVKVVKTYCHPS